MIQDLLFRLRAIFRRGAVEDELDDELRFHLEHETEKLLRSGLSPREAERRARLALGGLDPVKEECREARGVARLDIAMQDLRYALRGMRRRPSFAIAAMLTLGLGAGAISTVFTLANTLFFRQLPVDRPDRVVTVQATRRHGRAAGWVSYPEYLHFRDHAKTLEALAAHYSTAPVFVTAGPRSQEINGAVVSGNFFALLGLKPALGRFFRTDEDRVPDRDRVAVLSDELWRNWFAASPDALGAALKINGVAFTVIGVAPPDFRGITVQPAQLYIPTMMSRTGYRWCADSFARDCNVFDMVGRLRDGYTVEQARAEIATLVPDYWATAKEGENSGATAAPARGVIDANQPRSYQAHFVELLAGVAAVLLLVCCMNLAGLLIARNSARQREFAIRTSLGAGSARLMGQLITESLLLALGGGALGMLLSVGLASALHSLFYTWDGAGHPLNYNFDPEPRVILAVLGASIVAGFLAGIVPALNSIRSSADGLKRHASAVAAGPRVGRWLAAAQVAIAVALTAVAGLLATGARAIIAGVDYESAHVALMRVRPRLLQYSPEKAQQFVRTVIDRLEAMPGVESASMVGTGAALIGASAKVALPDWGDSQPFECGYIEIGPRYFETLRTPILRGREFDRRDTLRAPPVVIVTAALARRMWPKGDAAGQTIIVNRQPRQVIGIVKDVLLQSRAEGVTPYVFIPFWQNPAQLDARLLMRVKGDPSEMLPALARELHRVDPDVPIGDIMTLPRQMAGSISTERITASFISYTALLAVALSAIGLYGTLAFSVSRRTKEIGIRMAVGARSAAVLAMVVREGMSVVAAGLVLGGGLAIASTRIVRHLLYGSGNGDAEVYAAAVLVVLFAGLLACWIPARRAASVEPLIALREE